MEEVAAFMTRTYGAGGRRPVACSNRSIASSHPCSSVPWKRRFSSETIRRIRSEIVSITEEPTAERHACGA